MKSMCREIHSLGLKAGIYSTPWMGSGTLQQEVVVAVYTSYQAAAQLCRIQRVHQYHFLT